MRRLVMLGIAGLLVFSGSFLLAADEKPLDEQSVSKEMAMPQPVEAPAVEAEKAAETAVEAPVPELPALPVVEAPVPAAPIPEASIKDEDPMPQLEKVEDAVKDKSEVKSDEVKGE